VAVIWLKRLASAGVNPPYYLLDEQHAGINNTATHEATRDAAVSGRFSRGLGLHGGGSYIYFHRSRSCSNC